jgi:hypothetical protein
MFTADYKIRKYLINKFSVVVNLHFPSKASVDDITVVYIGDSSVQRTQVSKANKLLTIKSCHQLLEIYVNFELSLCLSDNHIKKHPMK